MEKKWFQSETEATGLAIVDPWAGPGVSLLIYHRNGAQVVPLRAGHPIVVGRTPPSDVQVRDGALSRQHARFELIQEEVWVEDLDSTNGTLVNGERIQRAYVPPGAEVTIGAVTVSVRVSGPTESSFYRLRGHHEFVTELAEEVFRAKSHNRKVGLMLVQAQQSDQNISRWCQSVRRLLQPFERMGVYGFSAIELLLPESGRQEAVNLAQRMTSELSEETPPLFFGIAAYPEMATSHEELISASRSAVLKATAEAPIQVAPAQSVRSWERPGAVDGGDADDSPVIASAAMRAVWATAKRLAASAIPVIIQGETGTGKEVVARAIHELGPRRERRMCSVNCGAIPSQLLESVLFGHEKGAFTGAHKEQKGVFEAADGGTLLLDEIGELPQPAQTALLRVLETKRVTRVGSTREWPVDVRVLAATHQDLESMCKGGGFRWDLFYRLNGMTLRLPVLRQRAQEIPVLAQRFIQLANRANACQVEAIDDTAMRLLMTYSWPGNVRELRNVIERAVVIAQDNMIAVDDLPEMIRSGLAEEQGGGEKEVDAAVRATAGEEEGEGEDEVDTDPPAPLVADGADLDFRSRVQAHLQEFEIQLLTEALERTGWNQTEAARLLRLPLRTLARKISAYKLTRNRRRPS